VGKNTFYQDDPRLTVSKGSRSLAAGKPWKIVMASVQGWSMKARIFNDDRLTILVSSEKDLKRMVKKAEAQKGTLMLLPAKEKQGRIEIRELLKKLAMLGVSKLLVEGGGELAWSFLEAGCVDRAFWILAPKVFGGRNAKTSVEGLGVKTPEQAFFFKTAKMICSGDDWILEGSFHKK
jgi:diaminohydroxyphosphoribosylaminopyrimidine deaminase/5-amino-6-(5-phosphoribosylamino)uracil reductase